jgi:transposase-like protein
VPGLPSATSIAFDGAQVLSEGESRFGYRPGEIFIHSAIALREAATLLAGGKGAGEVCKKLEVSPPTCHRWRQQYGGAKEKTVKRLKELEKENMRPKRLLADLSLDKAILKKVAEGNELSRSLFSSHTAVRLTV